MGERWEDVAQALGAADERFGQESRELETAEARAQNDETRLHREELNPLAWGLHGQRQLLRDHGWLGLQPEAAAVADAVLLRQRRDLISHRLRLILPEVGPPGIEPLVALELFRPVLRQVLEEVLPRTRAQEEQVRPDPAGAGLAGGAD